MAKLNKKELQNLKKMLAENPDFANNLKTNDLANIRKSVNPYNTSIAEKSGYLAFSYLCPQKDYLTKRIITSFIAFMNAAVDEWEVPKDIPPVSVYDYVKNPDIINEMTAGWQKNEKTMEKLRKNEEKMKERIIVKKFLEYLFQYDPHEHVRSAYSVPEPEENRKEIPTPAGVLAVKESMSKTRVKLIEDKRLQNLMNMAKSVQKGRPYTLARFNFITNEKITEEQFQKFIGTNNPDINVPQTVYEMVPPADIFASFDKYCNINFEKLTSATNLLYSEINDFEFSILPAFYSEKEKDVRNFIEKYKEELTLPINVAQTGKWTLLASYKQNREVTDYVSNDSLLLRRMMEQRVKDGEIAKKMTQKRAKKDKEENEKEYGPSSAKLDVWKQYRSGADKDSGVDLSGCDFSKLEPDECDDDHQEVPVFKIGKGGLSMEKNKFYMKQDI